MRAAFNLAESTDCVCHGNLVVVAARYSPESSIFRLLRGHTRCPDHLRSKASRDCGRQDIAPMQRVLERRLPNKGEMLMREADARAMRKLGAAEIISPPLGVVWPMQT